MGFLGFLRLGNTPRADTINRPGCKKAHSMKKISLPAIAVNHPITTLMLVTTLIGLGIISWRRLPIEFMIRQDFPMLHCYIPYPGAAPKQVENEVAIPAEGEFLTIPNLKNVTAYSNSGGCSILMQFDWETDMSTATADLRDRVERLKLELPQEIDYVFLRKFGSQDWPILVFALFQQENESELAHLSRTLIRNRLMRVPGVADIQVTGRATEVVSVDFDRDALESLSLPLPSVIGVLQNSSLNLALGKISDGDNQCYVRARNEISDSFQLENLIVGPNSIRLKDVAKVNVSGPSGADSFTIDGKHGVFVHIIKSSEANIVATCQAVRDELDRILEEPQFKETEVYVFEDKAEIILFAIHSLIKAGAYGCSLALIVLFLFLGRIRTTILVALVTPISLVNTFVFMYFNGQTLNIVTIASMIVSLGMLVDNAIVVMDNIHRYRQLGFDRVESAIRGASEVSLAITASTLTTVVVFIPVLYLQAGELTIGMREFAGPVTVALLTSLIIALTVIPLAACYLIERERHPVYKAFRQFVSRGGHFAERLANGLNRYHPLQRLIVLYSQLLGSCLDLRLLAALMLGIILATTYFIPYRRVGVQQMPDMDMRVAQIYIRFEKNYDHEMAKEIFDKLVGIVEAEREELGIKNLYVNYGSWGGEIRAYLVQDTDLEPGETIPYTTDEVRDIFAHQLPDLVPGGTLSFGIAQGERDRSQSVSIVLRGRDTKVLEEITEDFRILVASLTDVEDVETSRATKSQELQLDIDEVLASEAGVNPLTIARTVDFALRGIQLPPMKKEGREIPVRGQLAGEDRKTKNDLESLALISTNGKVASLGDITTMTKAYSPTTLTRENGKSMAYLTATVSIKNLAKFKADVKNLIDQFALPHGYSIEMGQRLNELDVTIENYGQALVLALILIYLVMASIFESYLLPFSILTTVPISFIGVYWSMYLTGTSMDTVAFIGAILMCGIVVNNGIVIVHHINQLRDNGLERRAAIVQAGINRFRPVMMTALTTILGCVPLAIGTGRGNDALNSLGRSLVGGLTSGTFLTLAVVPLVYSLIDDIQTWFRDYAANLAGLAKGFRSDASIKGNETL